MCATAAKPELHLDQPISPEIGARQEIFQEKRGVAFKRLATHEWSFRGLFEPW